MNKSRFRRDIWTALTILVFLLVLIFLIYPLISLFVSAFRDPKTNEMSFVNLRKFFTTRYYYKSLLNSIKVTSVVTPTTCSQALA